MNYPQYENNSIINLVSSLVKSMGGSLHTGELKHFDVETLRKKKNIVFIILDGMGYNQLKALEKAEFLNSNIKQRITSVFPTTTAAAITSFVSGIAPLEHAVTGWYMYMRELGAASLALPFSPRYVFEEYNIPGDVVYNFNSVFPQIERTSYYISPEKIINSVFSSIACADSVKMGYNDLDEFFDNIHKAVDISDEDKFVYAYWSYYDKLCHQTGTESEESTSHLLDLNNRIENLVNSFEGKDYQIIVTADHGHINVEQKKKIFLSDHPELHKCLILPLCGEPRAPYFYVKSDCVEKFKSYVDENFSDRIDLISRKSAIESGIFGIAERNPKFDDRVGDYIGLFKDNSILCDAVYGEQIPDFIGYHGGLSENEMFVPLITIKN